MQGSACRFWVVGRPAEQNAACATPGSWRSYARKHFPSTRYLDYAISVEGYTLQKVGAASRAWRQVRRAADATTGQLQPVCMRLL